MICVRIHFVSQDVLKNTSGAVNEAAANIFKVVVQKELVPCHLYISSFLPSVLRGIESRDVGVLCTKYCIA